MQYRQGDFLLIKVESIPNGVTKEKRVKGRLIIGYGEATGHHHSVAQSDASIKTLDNVRWLDLPVDATIDHQEHGMIAIPAGIYRIVQERAYHAGKIQRVRD